MTVAELIEKLKDEAWKTQDVLSTEVYVLDDDGYGHEPVVEKCDDGSLMVYAKED